MNTKVLAITLALTYLGLSAALLVALAIGIIR
jgi:hypothetical protein